MHTDTSYDLFWWVALVTGLLGILSYLITIPVLSGYAFWLVTLGFMIFFIKPLLTDMME